MGIIQGHAADSQGVYQQTQNAPCSPCTKYDINICSGTRPDDNCMLVACNSSSCTDPDPPGSPSGDLYDNYYEVFTGGTSNPIDIAAFHYGTWGEAASDQSSGKVNLCAYVHEAVDFNKPVLFDDDGGGSARDGSCNVEQ